MRYFFIALGFFAFLSCKKVKQEVQENKAMSFITNGQWKVTSLVKHTTDHSPAFNGYLFQFKSNNKVEAIKNGTVESEGNWEGDITTGTIKSSFPGNASPSLLLLNGLWQITAGGNTYVTAKKTENGEESLLRLDKN